MMNNSVDFRTASEQIRDSKHEKICALYVQLRAKYPKTAPSRIFMVIANQAGIQMTPQGVREVLIRRNYYQPQK